MITTKVFGVFRECAACGEITGTDINPIVFSVEIPAGLMRAKATEVPVCMSCARVPDSENLLRIQARIAEGEYLPPEYVGLA